MKLDLKQALISILIGACIAFFTTFFEGLRDILVHPTNNIVAGAASSLWYMLFRRV